MQHTEQRIRLYWKASVLSSLLGASISVQSSITKMCRVPAVPLPGHLPKAPTAAPTPNIPARKEAPKAELLSLTVFLHSVRTSSTRQLKRHSSIDNIIYRCCWRDGHARVHERPRQAEERFMRKQVVACESKQSHSAVTLPSPGGRCTGVPRRLCSASRRQLAKQARANLQLAPPTSSQLVRAPSVQLS